MALFLTNFLELLLDAAPWLVLGLVLGGMLKTLIPLDWLERHLKGEGFGPVVKAALLGAPLPLCSCGVLPAALGLRRAGASRSATTSFLVSTPETGVDSVFIMGTRYLIMSCLQNGKSRLTRLSAPHHPVRQPTSGYFFRK